MMKVFAIETSCDDTSLWVVTYDNGFWSNPILKTYSQTTEHQLFGWVVPEIAYRLHEEKILWLLQEIGYDKIQSCDAIVVTKEPWLPWSLVVGNAVAYFLADYFAKPIYAVNHIHGHLMSLLLDRYDDDCPLPRLVLTVSGGHNEIYYVGEAEKGWKSLKDAKEAKEAKEGLQTLWTLNIQRIGYSLDDAAGESYDKVARMLGGTYPWWPWIDRMAKLGNPRLDIVFKRILLDGKGTGQTQAMIDANHLNFSFSGMKSQVYNYLQKHPLETLSDQDIADICLEFSECVSDILVEKIAWATQQYECKTVGLVGWVSANDRLYDKLKVRLPHLHCLRPVKKVYSTDNAAMIGVVGIMEHRAKRC
jgi:N6-L-threonylcarbamoyladenine synthase